MCAQSQHSEVYTKDYSEDLLKQDHQLQWCIEDFTGGFSFPSSIPLEAGPWYLAIPLLQEMGVNEANGEVRFLTGRS